MPETNPGTGSLEAWWDFEADMTDSFGANDLTENNSPTYVSGKIQNAVDLERDSSMYGNISDNASLSFGDEDFTITTWVHAETLANNLAVWSKDDNTPREHSLFYNNATDRFNFAVYDSGASATTAVADQLGSPSTATWYFIACWYDASASTVDIQVNNGTSDQVGSAVTHWDSTSDFRIGARTSTPSAYYDGLIDSTNVWRKVLTADEKSWLYNSGNGRKFADIAGTSGGYLWIL